MASLLDNGREFVPATVPGRSRPASFRLGKLATAPPPDRRLPAWVDNVRRHALAAHLRKPIEEVYADVSELQVLGSQPAIVIANHVCVHDGAVLMRVADTLGRGFWLAAAPHVLRRHPWLNLCGLFAVSRGDAHASAQALMEIGRRAQITPNATVCFFPEGGHMRAGLPIEPERGVLAVAAAAPGMPIVPVSLRYEYFERGRPRVWVRAATPVAARDARRAGLRVVLDDALAALDHSLRQGSGEFVPILRADPRVVLLDNVPCDLDRIEPALRSVGLEVDCLYGSKAVPVDAANAAAAAVATTAGPLYRALVLRALTSPTYIERTQ